MFKIEKKLKGALGRAGILETQHGVIETPAFVVVGTKATVKALTSEQVKSLGAQVVLGNTYHLYLEPGDELIKKAGGFGKFMNWQGPTMTDSGGFQVFSLGAAFGKKVSKISKVHGELETEEPIVKMAEIDEEGVTFKSIIDGSAHRFTPERSMEIQHNLGADIIFAFDECTSPDANYEYQKEAMDRTHRWAERCLVAHKALKIPNSKFQISNKFQIPNFKFKTGYSLSTTNCQLKQVLFGIIQGGRHKDLREESARFLSNLDFDGYGIGGSFDKEDMYTVVNWVNQILPEEKPRHLLGIGEPADLFGGIENGVDLFDCVAPTRMARNGTLYTKNGKINILNAKYRNDFLPIEDDCECYVCRGLCSVAGTDPILLGGSVPAKPFVDSAVRGSEEPSGSRRDKFVGSDWTVGSDRYTKAYIAHLFHANEMLASTLASIHNLYFIVNLVKKIRQSILDDNFFEFKEEFLRRYQKP